MIEFWLRNWEPDEWALIFGCKCHLNGTSCSPIGMQILRSKARAGVSSVKIVRQGIVIKPCLGQDTSVR